MNKKSHFLISVFLISTALILQSKTTSALAAEKNCSTLPSNSFYFVPLDSIKADNNISDLKKEFSDSFFCEAANQLLIYYLSQSHVPVANLSDSVLTKMKASFFKRCSPLLNDTTGMDSIAGIIKEIAQKSKAELVIVPYSCSLQGRMVVQNAWRDGRGGPSYERPVKNIANASIHLQIWDKNGILLCESISNGKETKPMFYSFFKKRMKISSIITYSRKVFANPFVRAINEASRGLMKSRSN